MKSSHLLSLALIVLPVAALASEGSSSGTRGGGNAVVCFDSPQVPAEIRSGTGELTDAALAHVTSVETYDLLEAKLPRGFQANAPEIIPLLEGEAPDHYIARIAERLQLYVPVLADYILQGAKRFSRPENIVMQPHGLLRISDANEVGYIDSQNCVVATMAAQFNSGGDYFLNIDERLFNHPKHSALSKAVLLLHEYLYSQARIAGQGDSRNTRILVGRLITRNSLTVGSLIRELMDLGFDHGGYMDTYAYQVLTRIGARLLDQARSDVLDFNIRNKPHAIWMLGVFSCEPWISDFQAGRASITLLATMDEGNSKCTVATRKYGWSAVTRRQDAVLESLKSKYVSWSNLQPLLYGIPGLSDQTKNAVNDQVYGYMEVIGDSLRVNYPHDFTQTPEKDNVWNFLDAVIQSTTKCSPQDKICPQSVGEFAHSVDFDQVAIP